MANPLLEFQLASSGQTIVFNAANVEAIQPGQIGPPATAFVIAGGETYEVTDVLDEIVHAIRNKVST